MPERAVEAKSIITQRAPQLSTEAIYTHSLVPEIDTCLSSGNDLD